MIITTSYDPDNNLINRTDSFAEEIGAIYIARGKKSLAKLMSEQSTDELIVIDREYINYYNKASEQPFFFHPSIAILRINRIKQGDNDLMVQIANLKPGDSFLDCTLGMATDSLVASYIVGLTGRVVGLESQSIIAAIVKNGLYKGWPSDGSIDSAMKHIEVKSVSHYDYLKELPDKSFDIIYFDPMFRSGLTKSAPFNPIRGLANHSSVTVEAIKEARRVAKRMVILKESIKSNEFERLGFKPYARSASVTYGVISVSEGQD